MSSIALLQARCAENIAAMAFLGDVPVAPERNQQPQESDTANRGRTLSLWMEKDLVNTLGFLSSVKEDPNNVTAVCVQEMESSLCVMVTANAQDVKDSPYLRRVKAGFDRIFSVLGNASRISRDDLEEQVFGAIVAMCRQRILSRTRLDSKETKASLQSFLKEASDGLFRLKGHWDRELFTKTAAELIVKMNRFSSQRNHLTSDSNDLQRSNKDLEEIIEGFYKLSTTADLSHRLMNDLDCVKPRMDPCSRRALLNNINKISQYRSSATRLARIAKACPKARRAATLVVSLDSSAFKRHAGNPSDMSSLKQTLERIGNSHPIHIDLASLCHKLQKSVKPASKSYRTMIENTTANSKIHAEIQLISYLDTHPECNPPRFLASNKDACYLCNEFIAFHGKYVITRSHGRLYPGWRLPTTASVDVQRGFNAKIEELIARRVSQIMGNNLQKTLYPCESTPFSVASVNTLLTVPSDEACGLEESGSDVTVTLRGRQTEERETMDARQVNQKLSTQAMMEMPNEATTSVKCGEKINTSSNTSPHHGSSTKLSREKTEDWQRVSQGEVKCGFDSNVLRVYVEYTATPERRSRPLYFRIWRDEDSHEGKCGEETLVYDMNDDVSLHEIPWGKESRFMKIKVGDQLFAIELESIGASGSV